MIQFREACQRVNILYNFTVESIDDGDSTVGISPRLLEVQLDHLFSWVASDWFLIVVVLWTYALDCIRASISGSTKHLQGNVQIYNFIENANLL